MESYVCKCGKKFGSLDELNIHWADPERGPGPHFRLISMGDEFRLPPSVGEDPR